MSIEEAQRQRQDILNVISGALVHAFGNHAQSEPQLIANMVYHLSSGLSQDLSSIFGNYGVNFQAGGVFVHGQPQVTASEFQGATPNAVEIGDVLLLTTHKRWNGSISRNALLLQAKKTSIPALPDNNNQLYLYAFWPEFEYVRSTYQLTGRTRKVTGPNMYQGAKYLLIGQHTAPFLSFCCNHKLCFRDGLPFQPVIMDDGLSTAHAYYPELGRYSCFVAELYDFVFGNAGRPFVLYPPSNTNNWDQVITDLVTVTAKRASSYVRRATTTAGCPGPGGSDTRGQGTTFFLCGDLTNSLGGIVYCDADSGSNNFRMDGPPNVPSEPDSNEDSGGGSISVIEFTLEETKRDTQG